MEQTIVLFIPIVALAVIGVISIYFRKYTNDERLALIEKGVDAKIFNLGGQRSYGPLRFSFLMIGLGVGLLFGAVINELGLLPEPASYFSTILIFGGIGLYYAHVLEQKKRNKGENTQEA